MRESRPKLFRKAPFPGRHHCAVCSVVSAIFAHLSGRRGTDGRARAQRGSLHGGALGFALCPELSKPIRRHLRRPGGSWRVDETYVRVGGEWAYLYRAVDSAGDRIDFLLSPKRDLTAAKLFLRLALSGTSGYEAMHLIRKGQIRWLPKGDVVGQRRFIHTLFGMAA